MKFAAIAFPVLAVLATSPGRASASNRAKRENQLTRALTNALGRNHERVEFVPGYRDLDSQIWVTKAHQRGQTLRTYEITGRGLREAANLTQWKNGNLTSRRSAETGGAHIETTVRDGIYHFAVRWDSPVRNPGAIWHWEYDPATGKVVDQGDPTLPVPETEIRRHVIDAHLDPMRAFAHFHRYLGSEDSDFDEDE
jgi:hypothetical protein